MKTFTHAGTAVNPKGQLTYRYASGDPDVRVKILIKNNFTEVVFHALPQEMTREDAVAWLNSQGIVAEKPRTGREAAPKASSPAKVSVKKAAKTADAAAAGAAELVAEIQPTPEELDFFATQAGDEA